MTKTRKKGLQVLPGSGYQLTECISKAYNHPFVALTRRLEVEQEREIRNTDHNTSTRIPVLNLFPAFVQLLELNSFISGRKVSCAVVIAVHSWVSGKEMLRVGIPPAPYRHVSFILMNSLVMDKVTGRNK
jgi:hypothetical protein